jgi:hypothetical protein
MTVNTTWVSPVSATLDKTTGNTIDETMTDAWSSNLYHLGGVNGYIGCRVTHTTTQSIANGGPVGLAFNGESFDYDPNGEMHDTVTNNDRVVARTTGVYHISAFVPWAANATGYRTAYLAHNGVTIYASDTRNAVTGGIVTEQTIATSAVMAANDYFTVGVIQTSGGALNVTAGATLTVVKA